jgi:uncharacterized protein with ATP-grasp and redox domains
MAHRRLTSACLSCLTRGQLDKHPENISEEQQIIFKQKVLQILASAAENESAPMLVNKIDKVRVEMFGSNTDYSEIKHYFNEYVMKKQERIEAEIAESDDNLMRALQYSMTGNYIDFGAMDHVDQNEFLGLFGDTQMREDDLSVYEAFLKECTAGKTFLLVCDNCGEIVLDRLMLEQLKKRFPWLSVKALVRGGEVLNDATAEDAVYAGLDQVAQIVSNGEAVAGTIYEMMPEEAKKALDEADVILAKGQGNYESLSGQGRHVFYEFLCKCDLFTSRFHVPKLTGMFIEEKE